MAKKMASPRYLSGFPILPPSSSEKLLDFDKHRLDQLHRLLETAQGEKPVVICGPNGIGKTRLARMHYHIKTSDEDIVIWINASTSTTISLAIEDVANEFLNSSETFPNFNHDIQNILTKFVQQYEQKKVLFVLDNVQDIESIRPFLVFSAYGTWKVILTSTLEDLNEFLKLKLGPFSESDAFECLESELSYVYKEGSGFRNLIKRNRVFLALVFSPLLLLPLLIANNGRSGRKIVALLKKLGYFPLALTYAIVYLETCTTYQNAEIDLAIEQLSTKLDNNIKGQSQDPSLEHIAFTTWSIVCEKINQSNPHLIRLLNIMAYLLPYNIPLNLFKVSAFYNEIDILWKWNLIKVVSVSGQYEYCIVHELTQQFTRTRLLATCQEADVLRSTTKLLEPFVEVAHPLSPENRWYVLQAVNVAKFNRNHADICSTFPYFPFNICMKLLKYSLYQESLSLATSTLTSYGEYFGQHHHFTCQIKVALALSQAKLNNSPQALVICAELFQMCKSATATYGNSSCYFAAIVKILSDSPSPRDERVNKLINEVSTHEFRYFCNSIDQCTHHGREKAKWLVIFGDIYNAKLCLLRVEAFEKRKLGECTTGTLQLMKWIDSVERALGEKHEVRLEDIGNDIGQIGGIQRTQQTPQPRPRQTQSTKDIGFLKLLKTAKVPSKVPETRRQRTPADDLIPFHQSFYVLNEPVRGLGIIINCFHEPSEIGPSSISVATAANTMAKLRYDVYTAERKDMELSTIIKSFISLTEAKNAKSCFIFVLGHGSRDGLELFNKRRVNIYSEIIYNFDNISCPHLIGCPKIFVFDTCQTFETTDHTTPKKINDTIELEDALIIRTACPGHQSYFCARAGSIYCQAFAQIFTDEVNDFVLDEKLEKVAKRVTKLLQSRRPEHGEVEISKPFLENHHFATCYFKTRFFIGSSITSFRSTYGRTETKESIECTKVEWVKYNRRSRHLSSSTFCAAEGLFIAKTTFHGKRNIECVIIGQYEITMSAATFCWNKCEYTSSDFEVLVAPPEHLVWERRHISGRHIPPDAVVGGYSEEGFTYIGRIKHGSRYLVGAITQNGYTCTTTYNGDTIQSRNWEILVQVQGTLQPMNYDNVKKVPEAMKLYSIKPQIRFFRRNSEEKCLSCESAQEFRSSLKDLLESNFLKNASVIILITHGFRNTIDEKWLKQMKDQLCKALSPELGVVGVVGWGNGANLSLWEYTQAVANTQVVGNWIGKVAKEINQHYCDVHVVFYGIGHSLGAHVMGAAGRSAGKREEQEIFIRISGLDPAGPCFENGQVYSHHRLKQSDASHVDVIHTDGYCAGIFGHAKHKLISQQVGFKNIFIEYLGAMEPCGALDFYPNAGYTQPCPSDWAGTTSHSFAIELFIWSIGNPGKLKTDMKLLNPPSRNNPPKGPNAYEETGICVEMGYHCSHNQAGNYHIETNGKLPYGPVDTVR